MVSAWPDYFIIDCGGKSRQKEASCTTRPRAARAWQGKLNKESMWPCGKRSKLIAHADLPIRGWIGRRLNREGLYKRELESMYLFMFLCLDISSLASLMC